MSIFNKIFRGTVANDKTGDPLRTGGQIVNDNFDITEAALLDRLLRVDSVENIAGFSGDYDGQQISLLGWHPDSDIGGGVLYWDSAKAKSDHNGGTVFSPTVPWSVIIGNYLDGVGETDGSGFGCWVRSNIEYTTLEMFGGIPDGVTNLTKSHQAASDAHDNVFFVSGTYLSSGIQTTRNNVFYSTSKNTATLKHINGSEFPLLWNRVSSQRMTVKNLSLLGTFLNGVGTASPEFKACGVWCSRGQLEVTDCDIRGFSAHGIWTGNISDNWIIDDYVERVTITNNVIYNGLEADKLGDCVRIERSNNVTIENNEVSGGLSGVRTQLFCKDLIINDNHVYGSYADVGITIAHSTDVIISNNDCHSHFSHGIEADSSFRVHINDNKCHSNDKKGMLISEYTTPDLPYYAGYIDGVYVAPAETVWPKKNIAVNNNLFNNGEAGIESVSPESVLIHSNNFYNNSRINPAYTSHVRVSTTAAAGLVQDILIKNNNFTGSDLCPLAVAVSAYQYTNDNTVIFSEDNTLRDCARSDQPLLGYDVIDFESVLEKLQATLSLESETKHGIYYTLIDPPDAGQASATWNYPVARVARSGLLRIKHKGDSDTVKLIIQEYDINSGGVETFRRTLTNISISQTPQWKNSTILFNTTANTDYNNLKFQFVTDDDTGAVVDISNIEIALQK